MNSFRFIVFFLFSAFIAGCSTKQPIQTEIPPNQADRLIALDLVKVLSQVPALQVGQVSLQVPEPSQLRDEFGKALVLTLQDAGYALRTSGDDARTQAVSYTINQAVVSTEGAMVTYTVSVGDVSVRRTYRPQADGWVTPASDLQVRGAQAANLSIDNDLFQRAGASQSISLAAIPIPRQQPLPEFVAQPAPQAQVVAAQESSSAVALATIEHPAVRPIPQPVVTQPSTLALQNSNAPSEKRNVRNLGESNFASILNTLSTVKETVLIFGNDSTVLGSDNKAQVGQFVQEFDQTRDIFSVIGCSHGPTALSGGQESLALGRAQRIKEELMFAGVPESSILDEGCWAHDQFDKRMPRRGVVLALKRQG